MSSCHDAQLSTRNASRVYIGTSLDSLSHIARPARSSRDSFRRNLQSHRPIYHKEDPPRSQQLLKMVLVVTYAFLAPSHSIQINTLRFFSGNSGNLKPETLNPGLFCKKSMEFLCGMLGPSTDLNSVSLQWALRDLTQSYFLPTPGSPNLFTKVWIVLLFGIFLTLWNICRNLAFNFHAGIVHEHLF